jgi:hypothetical protein
MAALEDMIHKHSTLEELQAGNLLEERRANNLNDYFIDSFKYKENTTPKILNISCMISIIQSLRDQ